MGNAHMSQSLQKPRQLSCSKRDEGGFSCTQNIQNQEPNNLANRINSDFRKTIIASKNIMKSMRLNCLKKQNSNSICQPIEISQITLAFQEKMLVPVFEVWKRMKVKRPAFEMIQIDPKKFMKIKTTPVINDYELINEVGKGGFGSVFKAREKKSSQLRAVKKIKKQTLDEQQQMNLMNEFQILSEMDHPNIIKLYDIYDDKSNFYVVTQLCEGGNLLNYVNSVKISQEMIRDVMIQLFSAIRYMHSFKVLHRDIKLQNIVLVKKAETIDEKIQIKLIDFGISLNLNKFNQNLEPMGTLLYMSPESLQDKYQLTSDIWSCGIVLYMMATRKVPYNYRSDDQLIFKIQKGDIVRKHIQTLSLDLKIFLMQLLEMNYSQRINAAQAIQKINKKQIKKINLSQTKMMSAAKNLLDYDAKNNLVSIIQSYLVFKKINQDERQRLALIFSQIDEDKSGIIEIEEFKHFYSENSEHYDANEVQELLNVMDKNKSGKIDFNQFIIAMYNRRKLFQLHSLEEAFDYFDKDKSGEISKKELQSILQGIKHEEIQYLFAELDKNHDSKISKSQFLAYLSNYQKIQESI